MKKQLVKLALVGVFAGWATIASAGTAVLDFDVSAYLPEAQGFECVVKYQPTDGGTWLDNPGGNALAFGALEDPNGYGWWSSAFAQFFVCDMAPVGGVGIPSVTFTYANGNNPNALAGAPYNQRGGLDKKGILTVARVTGGGNNTAETTHAKGTFGEIGPAFNITANEVYGGWVRLYFGLGFIPASGTIDPPSAEAFTSLDHHGTYDGTVTATVTW